MNKAHQVFIKSLFRKGLDEIEFFKQWGNYRNSQREYHRAHAEKSRLLNPEKYRAANHKSYWSNVEKRRQDARNQRSKTKLNPDKKALLNKKRNKYRSEKRRNNQNYRLSCVLRTRVKEAIRKGYGLKSAKTITLIGCTVEECREHIESLWKPGMNWDNHGIGHDKWHIDHKIPCNSFDLTNAEDQKKCFHYTNLQPLWSLENLSKGDKQ